MTCLLCAHVAKPFLQYSAHMYYLAYRVFLGFKTNVYIEQ